MGLELREGLFDRVEVRTVGWQEEEPAAPVFQGLRGARAFVGAEVVENDDGSRIETWRELGFDIGIEGGTVHGAIDDPGGDQPVPGQASNERLGAPFAKGRRSMEPFAARRPAPEPGQVGFHRGLVNKDQPMRHMLHARLAALDPGPPGLGDLGPVTLGGDQAFFYMTSPPA